MKKIAFLGLVSAFGVAMLASCAGHVHTFDTKWSSNESSHWHAATCEHTTEKADVGEHTFDDLGFCGVCGYYSESHDTSLVFTKEKLGNLCGEFYAEDYVLNVAVEGATLKQGDEVKELKNGKIVGTGYSTVVTYTDDENVDYCLEWKGASWDKFDIGYMLPNLSTGDLALEFQPSIASIQGWYDGWEGELDSSITIYIISNTFNPEVNAFDMGGVMAYYEYLGPSFYLKSSFLDVDGETYIGVSMFDSEDIEMGYNTEDWNYFAYHDETDNEIYLQYIDYEENGSAWWTRPSIFLLSYWKDEYEELGLYAFYESGLYFSMIDEEAQTVYVEGDLEPTKYEVGCDENGVYYQLGDKKLRGTLNGLMIEEGDVVTELIPFFTGSLYEIQYQDFTLGDETIAYTTDWDTWDDVITLNGVSADYCCIARYGNQLAYYAVFGSDTYYIIPFVGSDAVIVAKNDVENIYFNEFNLKWNFCGEYLTSVLSEVVIDDDLNISIDGTIEGVGEFVYNAYLDMIVLDIGETYLVPANTDFGLFVAFDENDDVADIIVRKDYLDYCYGNWTSGKETINISDTGISYKGQTYELLGIDMIFTQFGEMLPSIVFGTEQVLYHASYDFYSLNLYSGLDDLVFLNSFVAKEDFDKIYGTYDYVGQYGVENVIVTEEGKLFVDTSNATKTGTDLIEYDYYPLYDEEHNVVLQFLYNETVVNVTFDGNGHCSIFVINYLLHDFFNIQGLYGDSECYVSVVDTKIMYNGNEVFIESIEGTTITGTVDESSIKLTFGPGSVSVILGENTPFELTLNTTQISSFITDVHEDVGGLSRDIKVQADGIYIRHTGTDEFTKVTDFKYVFDENGNVMIEFEDSLVYKFTIYLENGVVVIKGESSLPPIPPPPPFF